MACDVDKKKTCKRSVRYSGVEAVTGMQHMQDSLSVNRSEIGNQCSALSSGLVCSCQEDF